SAGQPVERVLAPAEVTGRKPSRPLVCRRLSDHRHPIRHEESEFPDSGRVVARNDVGVAPGSVHFGWTHPEGDAVDKHAAAPGFLDAFGEFGQPALKLSARHVGGAIEPAHLDQVRRRTIENLTPFVLVDLLHDSPTSYMGASGATPSLLPVSTSVFSRRATSSVQPSPNRSASWGSMAPMARNENWTFVPPSLSLSWKVAMPSASPKWKGPVSCR